MGITSIGGSPVTFAPAIRASASRQAMGPLPVGSVPCRVESAGGVTFEGELVEFDVARERMRVRVGRDGDPLWLPFSRMRRLTVLKPWAHVRQAPGAPEERMPAAAQERDYTAELSAGGHVAGRTIGHVRQRCGWFLYAPADGGHAVLRQFVPTATCTGVILGKSVEDIGSRLPSQSAAGGMRNVTGAGDHLQKS